MRVQNGTALAPLFMRQKIKPLHDRGGRTGGGDLALRHDHHVARQPRHFRHRMADIDDRHLGLVAQTFDVGQDLSLARLVQRSKRLVHQKQSRAGQQCPPDRHALLLAAGKPGRPPIQQMAYAEQLDHRADIAVALRGRREPAPVTQIGRHAQMRKQPRILEHHADAAFVLGYENSVAGVDQHPPVDGDAAALRADQPGDRVDQRGLAGTGRPEQRRQSARAFEGRIKNKAALMVTDVDRDTHSMSIRRPSRRANTSEATSAPIEMTMLMRVSRKAPSSPPGTCVNV